jgi:hypothetical protein
LQDSSAAPSRSTNYPKAFHDPIHRPVVCKAELHVQQEFTAARNDLNATLSERLAAAKREAHRAVEQEADDIEARIKEVAELEEKGFWQCEEGHEKLDECSCASATPGAAAIVHAEGCWRSGSGFGVICDGGKPMKLIKRAAMSGQEKYESDKERKEAETIVASKRQTAAAEQENVAGSEKTAQYFRGQAANGRTVADKVRNL